SGDERGLKLERQDNTDDWRIYAGATADSDLAFSLNNTLMGVIDGTTGNYVPSSDIRLKTDIQPVTSVLSQVMQLEPKTYKFIGKENGSKTYGFIAQDVETVFPEFVNEREDGYKGIAYDNFTVVAIQAIKEQQAIIAQQQVLIENLLQRVQVLEQE
ncbi:MAG TPA: tail fiber domain-containing protein, partial [Saprospiraceae bacterium]